MTIGERSAIIVAAGKYAEAEIHDINALLCAVRDFGESDDPKDHIVAEKAEKILQIFITRKRLGTPVTIKKLRKEFDLFPLDEE